MSRRETEYTDEFAGGLELLWGKGFLSPGGVEEVDRIVRGLDLRDTRVLDIGSGLGGPSMRLALSHGTRHVTGVDIESLNVARASSYPADAGVSGSVDFRVVDGVDLPFESATFDVIFSKDSITEVSDKESLFLEAHRVLSAGGLVAVGDWFRGDDAFTPEMEEWLEAAGVSLRMTTLSETAGLLRRSGFEDVTTEDRNHWYRNYSIREVERITHDARDKFENLFGVEETNEWIEETKLKSRVVAQGQLRPGHLRARKP